MIDSISVSVDPSEPEPLPPAETAKEVVQASDRFIAALRPVLPDRPPTDGGPTTGLDGTAAGDRPTMVATISPRQGVSRSSIL